MFERAYSNAKRKARAIPRWWPAPCVPATAVAEVAGIRSPPRPASGVPAFDRDDRDDQQGRRDRGEVGERTPLPERHAQPEPGAFAGRLTRSRGEEVVRVHPREPPL